jgi:FkbM family methyltransferase
VREERAAWFTEAARFTPLVAVETACGVYLVRTHDRQLGGGLFSRQLRSEFRVVADAARILRSSFGDAWIDHRTFVDVGANIGTSVIPAVLGGFARGVAVEPESENAQTLRLNLVLNGVAERVVVIEAAASNQVGTVDLLVNRERSSGKHKIGGAVKAKTAQRVACTTLDALVGDGVIDPDQVGLLWLDVQGHEGHVLEAATSLIGRCPLVVEWRKKESGVTSTEDVADAVLQYTHFVDMRGAQELTPTAALRRFAAERGPGVTDLLALNAR